MAIRLGHVPQRVAVLRPHPSSNEKPCYASICYQYWQKMHGGKLGRRDRRLACSSILRDSGAVHTIAQAIFSPRGHDNPLKSLDSRKEKKGSSFPFSFFGFLPDFHKLPYRLSKASPARRPARRLGTFRQRPDQTSIRTPPLRGHGPRWPQ